MNLERNKRPEIRNRDSVQGQMPSTKKVGASSTVSDLSSPVAIPELSSHEQRKSCKFRAPVTPESYALRQQRPRKYNETVSDIRIETPRNSPRSSAHRDASVVRDSRTPPNGAKTSGHDDKDCHHREPPWREKGKEPAFKSDRNLEVQVRRSGKAQPHGTNDAADGSKEEKFDMADPGSPTKLSLEELEQLFLHV